MNDISYEPKSKNGSAKILVTAFAIAASLCYLLTLILEHYHGLLLLGTVLLAVCATFVSYKYLLTSYVYSVFTDEGRVPPMLLIEQRQGNRSSLVCRVPLSAVLSLAPYDGKAYPARCHVFTATMRGGEYQLLHAREGGREFCVKLEADAAFLASLCSAIELARAEADE